MSPLPQVVWLSFEDKNTPSSRLRTFAVATWFEKRGIAKNEFPPHNLTEVTRAVCVGKKCDPQTLQLVATLKQYGARVIYDVCDPVWLQLDANWKRKWEPEQMIALADDITLPTDRMRVDLCFDSEEPLWERTIWGKEGAGEVRDGI